MRKAFAAVALLVATGCGTAGLSPACQAEYDRLYAEYDWQFCEAQRRQHGLELPCEEIKPMIGSGPDLPQHLNLWNQKSEWIEERLPKGCGPQS